MKPIHFPVLPALLRSRMNIDIYTCASSDPEIGRPSMQEL